MQLSLNDGATHSAGIHHPRDLSTRDCSTAPNGRHHKCRLMALQVHQILQKNDVFLYVIESVNLLVTQEGSGVGESQFHQCVRQIFI
jgi:hypothetical protein